jgi:predicted PurR-regulated permease PerM
MGVLQSANPLRTIGLDIEKLSFKGCCRMDNSFDNIDSPVWSLRTRRTIMLILLFVAGVFAWRLAAIWPPVIVSLILAYLLSPAVTLVQRLIPFGSENVRRTIATVLVFVMALLTIVLVFLTLVPAIVAQMRQFGEALPTLLSQIQADLEATLSVPITIGSQAYIPLEVLSTLQDGGAGSTLSSPEEISVVSVIQDFLASLTVPVLGALGSALSGILTLIFVLTMIFYLMKDGPHFIDEIEMSVAEPYRNDIRYVFNRLGQVWNAYLRGQLILSLSMGSVVFLSATVLGVRSPLVLGLISALLEFIPNLGPALALLPAAAFALFFPSTTIAGLEGVFFMLVVVIVWTGLQNLEAIFLVPRIMGDSLDLHPFVVIVAVIGGASLAGALGVILAAPVVASLRLLWDYLYLKLFQVPESTLPDGLPPEPPLPPVPLQSQEVDRL